VLGAVGILLLLPLLQMLFLAFLIAFLMFLPASALTRRFHLPYRLTVLLSFLGLGLVFSCALVNIIPRLIESFDQLGKSTQASYEQIVAQLQTMAAQGGTLTVVGIPIDMTAVRQFLTGQSPDGLQLTQIANVLGQFSNDFLSLAGRVFSGVAGLISLIFAAAIIALFLLIDLPGSQGVMTDWVPAPYRREITLLFAKLDRLWLAFFKAEVVIGLLIGSVDFVVMWLWGVPGALPLAIIAGTIGLIPTIGGFLAAIPVMVVCLLNGSTQLVAVDHALFTLVVLASLLVVNQVIYSVISPRISSAAVSVPAAVVVVGVLLGLTIAGILGALLVVPIIGSLRLFVNYILAKIALREPFPDEETPTRQAGFFSQVLYVKQSSVLPSIKRK
jgi:predicted PurR-regulated permease PerM